MRRRICVILEVPDTMSDAGAIARVRMLDTYTGMTVRSAYMDAVEPQSWLHRALGLERTTQRIEIAPAGQF